MNIIPFHIYHHFRQSKMEGAFEGGVLFVDIGGFTSLTEKMSNYGKSGAECISNILNNHIFTKLIDVIYQYHGFVATFAGDAFTAIFPDVAKGYECAVFIKENMTVFPIDTFLGKEKVFIKGGFAYGKIEWSIIGKGKMFSYYYKGYPIDRSAQL